MESTRDPVGATKLLLHYGANPYAQDNAGQTPILIALRQKHFLAAECLLSQQATPSQDCDAKILLLREASHQSDCPEVIWNQLGDVNVQNDCGQSALHLAAIDQKVTQIRNLHDHGADLELRDMTGQCPLQIAVRHSVKRRHVSHIKHSEGDVVSALLARGASVLSQAYSGWTPICEALEKRSVALLKRLCSYLPLEARDPDLDRRWLTTCIESESSASLSMLEVLLQKGVGMGSTEAMSHTSLLSTAVRDLLSLTCQEEEVMDGQELQPHQARRNSVDFGTPFSRKIKCEHFGICSLVKLVCEKISLLLSWGANPNLISDEGQLSGLSPQDALVRHKPLFACASRPTNSRCDKLIAVLITSYILDPEPLIRARKVQKYRTDFEWNDRVPLSLVASSSNRRSNRLLDVPGPDRHIRYKRASDTRIIVSSNVLSNRRPTAIHYMADMAEIEQYEASRKDLWGLEEDSA
jgi:ankyrin repeat protein